VSRYRALFALLMLCALFGVTTTVCADPYSPDTVQAYRRILLPLILKPVPPPPPPPSYTLNAQEAALFTALNAQRVKSGCPQLVLTISLSKAARSHSLDMAVRNYFGHTGSDGSRPATRAASEGYGYNGSYEAIAAGQETAAQVLTTWMQSKPHRDILMNCGLADGGVGFVLDTDGKGYEYYWTADLGAR
jgi:uncharacterized protein YkwD